MSTSDDLTLDCQTCVAANTTACEGCVVHHVLANDAGPIDFVPTPLRAVVSDVDRAVDLFAKAGLLDGTPSFVPYSDFESFDVPQMTP